MFHCTYVIIAYASGFARVVLEYKVAIVYAIPGHVFYKFFQISSTVTNITNFRL